MPVRDRTREMRSVLHMFKVDRRVIEVENDDHTFIRSFLAKVSQTHGLMKVIQNDIDSVRDLQSELLTCHSENGNNILNSLYLHVRKIAKEIMHNIKYMQTYADRVDPVEFEMEFKICALHVRALESFISECIVEYHNIQQDFKTNCKNRIKRQLEIAGVDDDTLPDREEAFRIFLTTVMPDMNISQDVIAEMQARQIQLMQLEKHIKKLHSIFFEVALLLEYQKVKVNRIENCVDTAEAEVTQALEHLQRVPRNHCKIIQAVCCLCMVGIMVSLFGYMFSKIF